MSKLVPLRITITVADLVPPPYPIHLDALLAFVDTRDQLELIEGEVSVDKIRALASDLPLSRHEQSGDWVWMASALMPAADVYHASRFYTQRLDGEKLALAVGNGNVRFGRYKPGTPMKKGDYPIESARGVFRNMAAYYPIITGVNGRLDLVAWCVGNPEIILDRLTSGRLSHIGARSRNGHGRVVDVAVDQDDDANENWKLRVRPWRLRDDDEPIQAAWRSPYWAAENRGQAFCPISVA